MIEVKERANNVATKGTRPSKLLQIFLQCTCQTNHICVLCFPATKYQISEAAFPLN